MGAKEKSSLLEFLLKDSHMVHWCIDRDYTFGEYWGWKSLWEGDNWGRLIYISCTFENNWYRRSHLLKFSRIICTLNYLNHSISGEGSDQGPNACHSKSRSGEVTRCYLMICDGILRLNNRQGRSHSWQVNHNYFQSLAPSTGPWQKIPKRENLAKNWWHFS